MNNILSHLIPGDKVRLYSEEELNIVAERQSKHGQWFYTFKSELTGVELTLAMWPSKKLGTVQTITFRDNLTFDTEEEKFFPFFIIKEVVK